MSLIDIPIPLRQSDVDIAIWRIDEDEQCLQQMCEHIGVDMAMINDVSLAKRRVELLVEQLLLCELLNVVQPICHTKDGVPFLPDADVYLSISHSRNYVVMVVSRKPVGVDVEQPSPKVVRVRPKFLNTDELALISAEDVVLNTLAWTAKEALYKVIGVAGLDFSDDVTIDAESMLKGENQWLSRYENRTFAVTTFIGSDYALSLTKEI
ncbi:MAG: 4'-phosphopantetheinyl transferase family protein [Muribaculaceae bacterium]